MPDLSRMCKLRNQTIHIRDKGSEFLSEHSPAGSEMDDGENSPGGVLYLDRDDPYYYLSGGKNESIS